MRHESVLSPITVILFGTCCLLASATVSAEDKLRIQTDFVPAGSHRLGQVVALATRKELLEPEMERLIEALAASGVDRAQIHDGSVAAVRIVCCGGPNERATARWVYIPATVTVELGDIVEYRVGQPPAKNRPSEVNTAMRVRAKATDLGTSCFWDPPDERMWMRILYCDWMPGEGWVKKNVLNKAWCKLPEKKP